MRNEPACISELSNPHVYVWEFFQNLILKWLRRVPLSPQLKKRIKGSPSNGLPKPHISLKV